MKNFFLTIIAVITAISSLLSSPEAMAELRNKGDISGFAESVSAVKELPQLHADENGDFTVLQFSDTHFTTGRSFSDVSLLVKMKSQTEKYNPDLVVVTGDMINDGDAGLFNKAYVLRTVAEMFEDMGQYWSYVPGNNDGLNYGSSADVVAYLSQYDHCLVADLPEISGGCQYSIDIYSKDEMTHSMIFIDTMDYDDEDPDHKYGYVHEDQVEWCKKEIERKKELDSDVTISVFLHENTPDFFRAAQYGEAYKKGYAKISKQDEIYNIPKNQPLDDVFRNSGCVGLLTMGHKHPLAAECCYYEGIYYQITPQTVLGSTLITIHTKAENTKEMYDFEYVV